MVQFRKKTVLVACGTRPEIGAAVELVIRDCAARHGWSERLELRLGGLGLGAGAVDLSPYPTVAASDCGEPFEECADLDNTPELFEGVSIVVADCESVAAELVTIPNLGRARILRLSEVGAALFEGDVPSLDGNFGILQESAPELLRRLIAVPATPHSSSQIGVPTSTIA